MPEKILVVDDDMDTLRLVGLMLERQGYQVIAASNGKQALLMAESEQPDLVLLDVMMPDLDGYEVTRQLRENPKTNLIPIIMFTAKSQTDDKLLGFEVGADDYVTKPTQPRELFAHIKAVLGRTAKAREVAPPKERGYMIGVLAAKGGLGVTTLALNLGIALRERSRQEVIVAEFRPGQGGISLELGYLKPEGLNRLLQRKTSEITARLIEGELVSHPSGVRFLLSSSRPKDAQYVQSIAHFEAIASQLPYLGRYIILDLGPSLSPITEKVANYCDELILVIEPTPQNILQTKSLIQDLVEVGIGEGRLRVVLINRVRSGMQLSWSQVQEQLGHRIDLVITPAPELAYQASTHNVPLILQQPDSLTADQFNRLAERIVPLTH